MKKELEEFLKMPEFNLFMDPSEISIFFIGKNKKKLNEILIRIYEKINQRRSEVIDNFENFESTSSRSVDELAEIHNELKRQFVERRKELESRLKRNDLRSEEIRTTIDEKNRTEDELSKLYYKVLDSKAEFFYEGLRISNTDALATHISAKSITDELIANSNDFSPDRYILFQGLLAKKYLKWIIDAESGKHAGYDEFCFDNGIIVSVNGNQVGTNIDSERTDFYTLDEIKTRLIRTMLKSNQLLQEKNKNKNKPISVDGKYIPRGATNNSKGNLRISGTSKDLSDYLKSSEFVSMLNPVNIRMFLDDNLLKKNDFIRLLKRDELSEDVVAELLAINVFSSEEVCRSYRASSVKDILRKRNYKFESAFKLYSADKLNMDDFEAIYGNRDDIKMPSSKFFEGISAEFFEKYYKNINKISELITHHILDFTASMDFLDALEKKLCISKEEKEELITIMNDFKPDELDNVTQNEMRVLGEGKGGIKHIKGLTIDPEIRKRYLKSIGDVKEIKIKGNSLIKDDSTSPNKKNSLDGYQLLVLPDKKVAILEKFYETERDKDDNVIYKRDSEGNLIPAIENATYIMPLGMARELATGRNKQELIRSRFVRRASHTANWVQNIEEKIISLNERAEFNQRNTEDWARRVAENYRLLRVNR